MGAHGDVTVERKAGTAGAAAGALTKIEGGQQVLV